MDKPSHYGLYKPRGSTSTLLVVTKNYLKTPILDLSLPDGVLRYCFYPSFPLFPFKLLVDQSLVLSEILH